MQPAQQSIDPGFDGWVLEVKGAIGGFRGLEGERATSMILKYCCPLHWDVALHCPPDLDPPCLQRCVERTTLLRRNAVPLARDLIALSSVVWITHAPFDEVVARNANVLASHHQLEPRIVLTMVPVARVHLAQCLKTITGHHPICGRTTIFAVPINRRLTTPRTKHLWQLWHLPLRDLVANYKSTDAQDLTALPLHEADWLRG